MCDPTNRFKFFDELSREGRFRNALLFLRSLQQHPVGRAANVILLSRLPIPRSGMMGLKTPQVVQVYPHRILSGYGYQYQVRLVDSPVFFNVHDEAEAAVVAYGYDLTIELYDHAPDDISDSFSRPPLGGFSRPPVFVFERASIADDMRYARGGEGRPSTMAVDAAFAVSGELGAAMEVNITRQAAVELPSTLEPLPPGAYRVIGATIDCQTQEDPKDEGGLRGELKVLLVPHGGPLPLGLQWDRSGIVEVAVVGPTSLPEEQRRGYSLVFHNLAEDLTGRKVAPLSFGDLLYDGWCPDSLRLAYEHLKVGLLNKHRLVARLVEDQTRNHLAEVEDVKSKEV